MLIYIVHTYSDSNRHSQNSIITIDWLPNLPMLEPCKAKLRAATFAHQGNSIICKEAPGVGVNDQRGFFFSPRLYFPSPSTLQQFLVKKKKKICIKKNRIKYHSYAIFLLFPYYYCVKISTLWQIGILLRNLPCLLVVVELDVFSSDI